METRRDFIKKAALLSGSGGVLGVLPESIQRAFAIDPEPGTTWRDAEHVVILMQENRSFDHCYGSLQGVRGFNDPRATTLPDQNPVWLQTNARGETYAPFRLNLRETKATWMGCLPHTWESQVDARNQGKYDQWLAAKASLHQDYAAMPLTLGYYTREDIPFYYALADAFTVCDQHFCSSLTGTMPNRLFFWTGTIRGADPKMPAKVENSDIEYESSASWATFPERLEENGISWKIYQNELSLKVGLDREEEAWLGNFGDNPLEWFSQYHAKFSPAHRQYLDGMSVALPAKIAELQAKLDAASVRPDEAKAAKHEMDKAKAALVSVEAERVKWSAENFDKLSEREKQLHEKAFCTNVNDPFYHELTTLQYRDGEVEREMKIPKGDVLHQFRQDVETGRLPAVSWLVAPENFCDHPDAAWYGAWYVSEALDILTRNPALWKKTIFILTYDENDGYFDHVPPFVAPHPHKPESGIVSKGIETEVDYVLPGFQAGQRPASQVRESSIGLGFRVPMVIASPWSRGGFVCSQVFDHTSTLQFLEKFVSSKTGREVKETNISAWRRTVSGDLVSAFRPYHGEKIEFPAVVKRDPFVEAIYNSQFKELPGFHLLSKEEIAQFRSDPSSCQWMPKQETGVRPSCALPYELSVDGALNREQGLFEVSFAAKKDAFGESAAGSPFTVYAMRGYRPASASGAIEWETLRNWVFAVAAGERVKYAWPLADFEGGVYHLRVYGPNGFFREFKGAADEPRVGVELEYERQDRDLTGRVTVVVNNSSSDTSCIVEVQDNAGNTPHAAEEIPPGMRRLAATFGSGPSDGWYDFTVQVRNCESYAQRFAGRVETGRVSITDPVMGGQCAATSTRTATPIERRGA